jgi:CRP-like cAMP-binding protein
VVASTPSLVRLLCLPEDIEPYDRLKLCDALEEEHFQDNELIIQEGEEGSRLYIVTEVGYEIGAG